MALISWIITNVTSILLPFELSPAFYQVGYALPAHSIFQVLIDIWSGGCNPQLNYALPVMFLYEILGITLSSVGVYRRSHYAIIKKENDEKALEDRIAVAVAEQQANSLVRQQTLQDEQESGTSDTDTEEGTARPRRGTLSTVTEQEEMADIIRREMSRPQTESDGKDHLGPAFALPYKD
jgi:hypothetical protein